MEALIRDAYREHTPEIIVVPEALPPRMSTHPSCALLLRLSMAGHFN
ncbi:hypothetical protein [Acinetobacter sp. V102_4]|nr:hypothetical protein [Acinetobacter sp. V102_4]